MDLALDNPFTLAIAALIAFASLAGFIFLKSEYILVLGLIFAAAMLFSPQEKKRF